MAEKNDVKLINECLKGNGESLGVLVKRYLKLIYGFVLRYVRNERDAEDLTQEIFVKAWRNLKQFDQKRNFQAWVFGIAKNTCIDFFRKEKALPFSEFSAYGGSAFGGENENGENFLANTLIDPSPLPDELSEKKNTKNILEATISQLSPKYRLVLNLYYNNNLTLREIAESLKEPLHTIKSRHRRALIQLKKLLPEL